MHEVPVVCLVDVPDARLTRFAFSIVPRLRRSFRLLHSDPTQGIGRGEARRDQRFECVIQSEIGGDFAWMLRRAAVRLIPTSLVKPVAMAKATIEARLKK